MKIEKLCKFLPMYSITLDLKTDSLRNKKGFVPAFAVGPFIFISHEIRNILKNHKKHFNFIYEHEKEHVRQWYKTFGVFSILYIISNKFRVWAEESANEKAQKETGLDIYDIEKKVYDVVTFKCK